MSVAKVIVPPNLIGETNDKKSVFLAGGITGCPDWQSDFIDMLHSKPSLSGVGLTVFNPRRPDFDAKDPNMGEQQIIWEYRHLDDAAMRVFWFPKETLCPITLFELGAALWRDRNPLFVGVHPEYKRAFDVRMQTSLRRREVQVFDSIELLADMVHQQSERNS